MDLVLHLIENSLRDEAWVAISLALAAAAALSGISEWLLRPIVRRSRVTAKIGEEPVSIDSDDISGTLDRIRQALTQHSPPNMVFLSYTQQDREFALRLAEALRANGVDVWMAEERLRVGDSLAEQTRKAMDASRWFAAIISPAALDSEWTRYELETALKLVAKKPDVFVLPVLYAGEELPPELRGRVYADFRKDFNTGLTALLRVIAPRQGQAARP